MVFSQGDAFASRAEKAQFDARTTISERTILCRSVRGTGEGSIWFCARRFSTVLTVTLCADLNKDDQTVLKDQTYFESFVPDCRLFTGKAFSGAVYACIMNGVTGKTKRPPASIIGKTLRNNHSIIYRISIDICLYGNLSALLNGMLFTNDYKKCILIYRNEYLNRLVL